MNRGATILAIVVVIGLIQLLSPRGRQTKSKLERAWEALWQPKAQT